MGQVKEHPPSGGGGLQNGPQKCPLPAPHIDNRAQRREVIGGHHGGGNLGGTRCHRRVENRRLVWMLREIGKKAHPKEMVKGSLARLDAVQEGTPRLLVQRPSVLERNGA